MKKIILAVLLPILCLLFSSCGGGNSPSPTPKSIRVWSDEVEADAKKLSKYNLDDNEVYAYSKFSRLFNALETQDVSEIINRSYFHESMHQEDSDSMLASVASEGSYKLRAIENCDFDGEIVIGQIAFTFTVSTEKAKSLSAHYGFLSTRISGESVSVDLFADFQIRPDGKVIFWHLPLDFYNVSIEELQNRYDTAVQNSKVKFGNADFDMLDLLGVRSEFVGTGSDYWLAYTSFCSLLYPFKDGWTFLPEDFRIEMSNPEKAQIIISYFTDTEPAAEYVANNFDDHLTYTEDSAAVTIGAYDAVFRRLSNSDGSVGLIYCLDSEAGIIIINVTYFPDKLPGFEEETLAAILSKLLIAHGM